MRTKVALHERLLGMIVGMVFIFVFSNPAVTSASSIVSPPIYAIEDTTIVYEGIDSNKYIYEDGGLGYLDVGYQGTYGPPIEVQSLLKFELPPIPEGYQVETANLYFPVLGGTIHPNVDFFFKVSTSTHHNWTEDTITPATLPTPNLGSTQTRLLDHTLTGLNPKPTLDPFDFTSYISEENEKTNPRATFILSAFSAEEARNAGILSNEHYIQTTETHMGGDQRPHLIMTYTETVNIEITGVTDGGLYNTNVTPHFTLGTATLNGAPFTSGTIITNEGTYTLVVTHGDQAEIVQFTIDKTPPTATVLINNGSYFTNHQFVDVRITPDPYVNDIVSMRYSVNESAISTTQPYHSQFSIGVGSENGDKSVSIQLIDAAGNISPLYFWNFLLNSTIPTGSLTINDGAAYTTEREVDLLITPDASANEIVSMQFSTDNHNWSSAEAYNPSKTYTLPPGDGDKTVYVRLADRFGNIGVVESRILLDMTPPTASILINNGSAYTNNANVAVEISPDAGVNDIAFIQYTLNGLPPTTIAYTNSFQINVGNTNEEKEVTVTLIDGAGHSSPTYSTTFILDTVPPTGTVVINGGATYAASAEVTLTFTLGDGVTDVARVQFSNDNATWSTEQTYSPSMSYTLPAGEGNKTVYVRFIDHAGNVGTAQDSVILDTVAPTGTLILTSPDITNAASITFTVTSPDADYMEFGEADQPYEARVAYSGTVQTYTLQDAEEDGVKTIQVRLSDQAGNTTILTADVTLDRTPPTGTVVVNGGELYANAAELTVEVTPAAGVSDIVNIRYSVNDSNPTTIAYAGSFVIDAGNTNEDKAITVELIDEAGNVSPEYTATITLDTEAPTGTVAINGGAASTASADVTLTFTLGAGVTDVARVQFSNDNATWSTEQTYSPSMSYTLPAGDGTKTVYVRLIDYAGNVGTAQDSVILDTVAPTGTLILTSPDITNAASIMFTVTSPDADYMEFGEADQPYEARVAYSGTVQTYTLQDAEEDGVKTIRVRLSDQAGNTTVLTADVTLDRTPPTGTVVVNGGELYANAAELTVEVTPAAGVSDIVNIRYSVNDSTPTTIAYAGSFVIDAGNTNEDKAITVELIDEAGNVSPEYTATITLDTEAPTGTVAINGGAAYAASAEVTLTFTLGDGVTDVAYVQFSNDNLTWSTELAYSPSMSYTLPAGDGTKTVYVRFIDHAGNVGTAQDSIIVNTSAPVINDGISTPAIPYPVPQAPVSENANVRLRLGANEAERPFTGQVIVQGETIEVFLTVDELTWLSQERNNQEIEVNLLGTYEKAQLVISQGALEMLALNGNDLMFGTATHQFALSNHELKQMLAGSSGSSTSSFVLNIQHQSGERLANAEIQAEAGAYQLLGVPVTFELLARNEGQDSHQLERIGTISLIFEAAEGLLPSAVLKQRANGEQSPVTAHITTNSQSYQAVVTGYGSGTYTFISKQARFSDVSGWSLPAVEKLASKLVLSGVNATTFEPKRPITRAEFATIISKALGMVETTSVNFEFTDVAAEAWYSDAVAAIAELGLMNGYPDGTYAPARQMTREEAMVIIARVSRHLDSVPALPVSEADIILGRFHDEAQIGSWSRNDIAFIVQEGIITGDNGKLSVKDSITREQVAVIIVRLLERAGM